MCDAPAMADLIDTSEACELLGGLDKSTVSRWVQLGQLKAVRRVGRAFLFDRREVLRVKADLDAKAAVKASVAS